jgi:hypothetical protein
MLDVVFLGVIPCVQSDEAGKFGFKQLEPGRYLLYAKDESTGYPDKSFQFYGDDGTANVKLSAGVALPSLQLRVGPKAAVIMGTVTDQDLGVPVSEFSIRVEWASNPKRWLSVSRSPQFRMLVPSNVNLVVRCEAKGYEPWVYKPLPGEGPYLNLQPGKQKALSIVLTSNRAADKSHD